jgi:hypothetical protein
MNFRSHRILELFTIDEKLDLMIYQISDIRNFGSEFRNGWVVVFLFNTFFIQSFREGERGEEQKQRMTEGQSTHTPQPSLIFLNIIVIIQALFLVIISGQSY